MANWAKLQEQLTGLPVVKRDKHSIHFAKGDGQIVANFSGKPCHYQDTDSIWKALDTAIVELEDGSLGAKGVPVRLNLNGLVRLINENNEDLYSQVTTRVGVFNFTTRNLVDYINLPVGTVQDDLLIKDTDLYSHTLRLTETGLREELVIKKKPAFITDKANLWLVLDTIVTGVTFEDGWLDQFEIAEMHFPPPTATDAEGREGTAKRYAKNIGGVQHIFTGLKFSELYRAAYPVTIDPDFAVQPDATAGKDAMIYKGSPTNNYGVHPNIFAGKGAEVFRGLLQFDVSSIDSGVTVTAGTVSLYCTGGGNVAARDVKFHRLLVDWTEGGQSGASGVCNWNQRMTSTNWGAAGGQSGTDYAATATATTSVSAYTTWYDWDILADVQAWVGGTATNYGNFLIGDEVNYFKAFASSDYTTDTTLRPKLSVTYTAGSTGVPKHFLHYARLRSN